MTPSKPVVMQLRPALVTAMKHKPMINLGAGFDIPTGRYVKGIHGENILNAGLGFLTGVVGIGNQFKSTIMHWMTLTAAARMGETSFIVTYDTEINIHEWHLESMVNNIEEFKGRNILADGTWQITDKIGQLGDVWYDAMKDYMVLKKKEAAKYSVKLPLLDRDGKNLVIPAPTFAEIDSASEFVTQDVVNMQDDNKLGEKGANTLSMRQGLQKNRLLMELPALAGSSFTYFAMSGHLGDEFNMDPHAPPKKKLQYLQQGQKLKGLPEKFTFVMNNCYWCYSATPLRNQSTKAPEYPRNSDDDLSGDTDLCEVTVRQLRSKSGPSGMPHVVVVSQSDGVQPELTEFHYIKNNGRFGLEGNDRNYTHSFCPDIALSRTAVRGKLKKHPELRRAMNISCELLQMITLWRSLPNEYICTPRELYDDLTSMGYDMKDVLFNTRGWWAPVGVHTDKKFLSTMDMLQMRTGEYVPHWMSKEEAAKINKSKAKPAPKYNFTGEQES